MSTYLVAFVVCDYGFKEATTKKNTTVKYYYCYFQESCDKNLKKIHVFLFELLLSTEIYISIIRFFHKYYTYKYKSVFFILVKFQSQTSKP